MLGSIWPTFSSIGRQRLVWRLIAPTLGLSLLLLLMGGVSAWYVHRSNVLAAEMLDREIKAVFDAEELLLAIRDSRRQLDRYEASRSADFLKTAIASQQTLVERLEAARLSTPENEPGITDLLREMDKRQRLCFERLLQWAENSDHQNLDRKLIESLRQELSEQLLEPARQLLDHRRNMARRGSSRSLDIADQIGQGLFALGVSGALAGLLAGVAIARGFNRSLEQLGVSVRQILGTLEAEQASPNQTPRLGTAEQGLLELPSDDPLPLLRDSLRTAMVRSASVVQELQAARRMSERSDQLAAIGQLAAGLAHEIRNPLTSMKLLAQTAQDRHRPLEGDDLRILEEEISRLEQLLQTFLDFARPSRLRIERIDYGALIEDTVSLASQRADQQGIELRFNAPDGAIYLDADNTQLRQVVLNLLLNALDAQREGGEVRLKLVMEPGTAGSSNAVLTVQDEGPGIPWGWDEKIFEPFASTKETGIGLGLTICRRIIESHGGTIAARSLEQGGAEFEVRLPMSSSMRSPRSRQEVQSSLAATSDEESFSTAQQVISNNVVR